MNWVIGAADTDLLEGMFAFQINSTRLQMTETRRRKNQTLILRKKSLSSERAEAEMFKKEQILQVGVCGSAPLRSYQRGCRL